ncbi:MAG: hypothetical protein M1835_002352 [Candelina submexicana]|nr:MAG: hypothetical protein M1835_002352 [Candelina submexicana]
MHTASKNTGAKADVENKRPNNDNPGSMEVDSRKDVALRHAVRDSQATRADQEAESRFENTLFVKSPVEKDELEDEGEEYDEDKEEARVEAILGFKPKPRIRPKGIRGTDGQNVATEFGSVPQEEEEWRC